MRIGYSFWGFLGTGVVDTPDGGRSHRRTLIDALRSAGGGAHEIVFLQSNRDLLEADTDLRDLYEWDSGLPELDALFLEWRWPIPGRNTTACGSSGHTCDLHRQEELLRHYSVGLSTPTILWDKDLQLPSLDPLRRVRSVTVCEAAQYPSMGARRLLFPLDDAVLDLADPKALAARPRPLQLVYVGNQYDRDEAFQQFFAPAAPRLRHRVAGKWPRTDAWPEVVFSDRCSFQEVEVIHGMALATVLLLPDRYARVGQVTQRIFEAVLAGCLPLTPSTIREFGRYSPAELHVRNADDVVKAVQRLDRIAGTGAHASIIADCLRHLDIFRVSQQVAVIQQILSDGRVSSRQAAPE